MKSRFLHLLIVGSLMLMGDVRPAQAQDVESLPETPAKQPTVTPVPERLRQQLRLDPFYQKYLNADGIPILSSANVSDAALIEARYLIHQMLDRRPDIRRAMVGNRVRITVMAPTEMTTDVPEQRNMKPKEYWDRRARGLGGRLTSCGEENLLHLRGDRYRNENILIHEFAHAIHRYGIGKVDQDFDKKLRELFVRATEAGRWKNTYAATNHSEYWAEGVQSYFDCNARGGPSHGPIDTRDKLAEYDPELFKLIDETFGKTPWRYVRRDQRKPPPEPRR